MAGRGGTAAAAASAAGREVRANAGPMPTPTRTSTSGATRTSVSTSTGSSPGAWVASATPTSPSPGIPDLPTISGDMADRHDPGPLLLRCRCVSRLHIMRRGVPGELRELVDRRRCAPRRDGGARVRGRVAGRDDPLDLPRPAFSLPYVLWSNGLRPADLPQGWVAGRFGFTAHGPEHFVAEQPVKVLGHWQRRVHRPAVVAKLADAGHEVMGLDIVYGDAHPHHASSGEPARGFRHGRPRVLPPRRGPVRRRGPLRSPGRDRSRQGQRGRSGRREPGNRRRPVPVGGADPAGPGGLLLVLLRLPGLDWATGPVAGPETDIHLSEPERPDGLYGWVKLTGEQFAAELAKDRAGHGRAPVQRVRARDEGRLRCPRLRRPGQAGGPTRSSSGGTTSRPATTSTSPTSLPRSWP